MPIVTDDMELDRWSGIVEGSDSNYRTYFISDPTRTDIQAASSVVGPSAPPLKSFQNSDQTLRTQISSPTIAAPDLSLLSSEGTSAGDGTTNYGNTAIQPSAGHTILPLLEAITEDDEAREQEEARKQVTPSPRVTLVQHAGSEEALASDLNVTTLLAFEQRGVPSQPQEQAHDQSASLPVPIPTMDIKVDKERVSEFCSNDDGSDDRAVDATSTSHVPQRQGMLLYRTNTMESIRTRLNHTLLGRTFTSGSSWSTALTYAPQFEYTLAQWCEKVDNSASLQTAIIVKVDRYRQQRTPYHRFLVFQLRREGKCQDIFLRLDRLVDPRFGPLKFISASSVTPANDRALLAADEGRAIRGNTPIDVQIAHEARLVFQNTRFYPPTLSYLQHILKGIGHHMSKYRLTMENCWLFCAVCLGGLRKFEGTFTTGESEHVGLGTATDLRESVYAELPKPEIITPREFLRAISTPSVVISIAVSPDGNYIVSGHTDDSVRLWDAQTGVEAGDPFKGHTADVVSVAFSPNGRWIVSGSEDATIRLWDVETRTAVGEPLRGHSGVVCPVAFSPDGERIISGSWDRTIRLWDRATGTAIGEPLQGHTDWVTSVAFSPDGRTIASGSDDNTIRLWDATMMNAIRAPLVRHTAHVRSVAFAPHGRHLVSSSNDGTVRIWDTATGIQICKSITNDANSVAYSPDGRYIASGSNDGSVRFWDATMQASIGIPLMLAHSGGAISISFFPDGRRIASCGGLWYGSDRTIYIWKAPV